MTTDRSFHLGMVAGLADSLAAELHAKAARLRDPSEIDEAKIRIAEEVRRSERALRAMHDDKAARIALVFAVEDAIANLEHWQAAIVRARIDRGEPLSDREAMWRSKVRTTAAHKRLAKPFPSREAATDLLALARWVYHATAADLARDLFAVRFPEHAARLRADDYERAVEAVRLESGAKWETLARIVAERLRLATEPETLKKYVRQCRARFGR